MKRCPTCNRIYTDDALSFCLEDGIALLNTNATTAPGPTNAGASDFDPNMTFRFDNPRDTSPPPTQILTPDQIPYIPPLTPSAAPGPTPPAEQPVWTPPVSSNPPPPAPASTPSGPTPSVPTPKKKSALPWIAIGGGIVALLLLAVAGVIGLAAYLGNKDDNTNKNNNNAATPTPRQGGTENKSNTNNMPPPAAGVFQDDFSIPRWPVGESADGSVYADGQYIMHYTVPGRYIVVYAPENDANYRTDNAKSVAVETTHLSGAPPAYAYGLVINGSVTNGNMVNGYAFLVETGTGKCAIVSMTGSVQTFIVPARKAPMVKTGNATNNLEVRINGTKMDFYVNQQLAASAEAKSIVPGRVGFYTSAGGPVAFDNLAIAR